MNRVRHDPTPISGARTRSGFRRDIQGIRGFALIVVLACHAELPFAAGGFVGLDVFYVLSGFLITGLIMDEIDRTGTVSLRNFYARRARRLLPLAVTVLAVIGVGALLVFSTARTHTVSEDIVAAALYFANWRFMAQAVDYFAFDDAAVSPVQHFWSLSVEEQFYILWPILLLGGTWLVVRAGWGRRALLWLVVAPLGLASFAYGVHFTGVDADQAYFSTLARGWELALGGALALVLPLGLRMPSALSAALAGAGVIALLATTAVYDASTPYPGWQALLPALATVAMIVAGTATEVSRPVRVLASPALQDLGKISYAWYLWHWPVIVFAAAWWGELSTAQTVLATLAAWVPAIVSHHLIEERFRRSRTLAARPRRALALGLGCTVAAVLLGLSMVGLRPGLETAPAGAVPGARTEREGVQRRATAVRPQLADAEADRGQMWRDGCLVRGKRRESGECVYGDPDGSTTVVLLGDSHAIQYGPTLRELAARDGWRLVTLARASCPIGDVDYQPTCNAWRADALRRIEREEKPDLVVASSSTDDRFRVKVDGRRLSRTESQPLLEAGYARTFRRLSRTGARVAVIRDQARAPFNVAACVSDNAERLRRCAFEPDRVPLFAFPARGAVRAERDVKVIDPMDALCPVTERGRRCPAVIGNALVYRDTYHLTATYARTLADWLEPRLPDVD